MSAGKKKEVKSSMNRLYSRAAILASAVVFGGITIAQVQKDPSRTDLPPATLQESSVAEARPIPAHATPIEIPSQQPSDASQAIPANAEFVEIGPASEPSVADDSTQAVSASAADLPDQVAAAPLNPSAADSQYAEPSPLLPEAVAFPEELEPSPDVGAHRSNPYRSEAQATASVYSDDAHNEFASAEADDGYVALPDVDDPAPIAADDELMDDNTYAPAPQVEATQQPTPQFDTQPYGTNQAIAPAADSEYGSLPPGTSAGLSTEPPDESSSVTLGDDVSSNSPSAPTGPYGESSQTTPKTIENQSSAEGQLVGQPALEPGRLLEPAASPSQPRGNSAFTASSPVQPASVEAIEGNIPSIGKPGPQSMEGPQTPSLTIQKIAPEEIQVGRLAKFQIRVRNNGRVSAENVIIRDEVPAGTNFVQAEPKASRADDGAIFWEVGSLAPGQEIAVTVELMPVSQGQIGSVATVSFQASVSARTRATKPDLVLEHTGPLTALVGEDVQFSIKLSNPGTGAATHVVLEEDVPAGLAHASGARLEYEVGTIAPGQTRHMELTLKADQAGHVTNSITVRADGGLEATDSVELEIVAPELQVSIDGPKRRYLERQATFTVGVANPGTAPAQNVQLIARLPTGLKFVSTNNSGYYDQSRHSVVWSLDQLPAGEMGKAQFTAMPVEMGAFQVHAEGRAEMGLEAKRDHDLTIEGIAALHFELVDKIDPIEIGGQTTYEIKVVNQGSKPATRVQFVALVPDGLQPIGAQGPTNEDIEGQRVAFAPLDRLAPQEQVIYRVAVAGRNAGDHRFRVQMTSDDTTAPVIKEESTRVYAD